MENIPQTGTEFNESPLQVRIFAPEDLAYLGNRRAHKPFFESVATQLVALAQEEKEYASEEGGTETRFAFGEFGNTALEYAAMFRMCRVSIDELEADFKAAAKDEAKFHRKHAAMFDSINPKTPAEQIADLYWQVRECLDAAGLDFDALAEYHTAYDAGVTA